MGGGGGRGRGGRGREISRLFNSASVSPKP